MAHRTFFIILLMWNLGFKSKERRPHSQELHIPLMVTFGRDTDVTVLPFLWILYFPYRWVLSFMLALQFSKFVFQKSVSFNHSPKYHIIFGFISSERNTLGDISDVDIVGVNRLSLSLSLDLVLEPEVFFHQLLVPLLTLLQRVNTLCAHVQRLVQLWWRVSETM